MKTIAFSVLLALLMALCACNPNNRTVYVSDAFSVYPDRVVQDSFVKLFSGIANFEYRGEGSLKAWFLRIVANEAISFTRRQSRITFVDEVPEDVSDDEPEVERVPPAVLTKMIGELPEGYRLVLNMFVFEQRSHKEIADLLGIKESTSASQYLRAKKFLAKKINEYLNNINEKEYE